MSGGISKVPGSPPPFPAPPPPTHKSDESKPLAASKLINDPLKNPPNTEPFTVSTEVSDPALVKRAEAASSSVLPKPVKTEAFWEGIEDPRLKDLVQHHHELETKIGLLTPRSQIPVSSSSTTPVSISFNSILDHLLTLPNEALSPKLQKLTSDYKPLKDQIQAFEIKIRKNVQEYLDGAKETPETAPIIANIRKMANDLQKIEQQIEQQFSSELRQLELDKADALGRIQSWTPGSIAPTRAFDGLIQKILLKYIIYPATSLYSLNTDHGSKTREAFDMLSRGVLLNDFTLDPLNLKTPIDSLRTDGKTFISEEKKGFVHRVKFYSEDQIQLDGCLVFSDPNNGDLHAKKIMVVAYGNGQPWEFWYHHAKLMARKYGINVMVYNPRGVILSKGNMVSTEDAVKDCKAAIQYAYRQACPGHPERLGVFGQSISGGVTACALQELKAEGKIGESGVGLYINNHSYRSLKFIAKGIVRDIHGAKLLNSLSQRLLNKAKHDVLNAKKAVANTKLADRVVVVSSSNDIVISGSAQLKHGLLLVEGALKNEVTYIDSTLGHIDIERYILGHSEDLPEDDPRQALYRSIIAWSQSS